MIKLSIICAYRDRENRFDDFVEHYSNLYSDAEIIVLRQSDKEKFKKGQLYNIGFLKSVGDIIAFIDIDIRLINYCNFIGLMKTLNYPYYAYNLIKHATLKQKGEYVLNGKTPWENSPGGLYVFTREQYESMNGHSNLYLGHSWEDTEIRARVKPKRVFNTILHLSHGSSYVHKDFLRNKKIYDTRDKRDTKLDGLKQTVFNISKIEEINRISKRIDIDSIGVCDDFKYKDCLMENF